jgi:hypothetical protein
VVRQQKVDLTRDVRDRDRSREPVVTLGTGSDSHSTGCCLRRAPLRILDVPGKDLEGVHLLGLAHTPTPSGSGPWRGPRRRRRRRLIGTEVAASIKQAAP